MLSRRKAQGQKVPLGTILFNLSFMQRLWQKWKTEHSVKDTQWRFYCYLPFYLKSYFQVIIFANYFFFSPVLQLETNAYKISRNFYLYKNEDEHSVLLFKICFWIIQSFERNFFQVSISTYFNILTKFQYHLRLIYIPTY